MINFNLRRTALLMQSAYRILYRHLNSPRRSRFGRLPWLRGSDADVAFPRFFLFSYILSLIYRAYPNRANLIYVAHCARKIAKVVFEVTAMRIHLLNQAISET